MSNFTSTDWLIALLYLFSVLAIGFSLRSNIKTGSDYFQAGRSLPTWICALAFIAASLGAQEVLAMGAAGAKYGFAAAFLFSLGAIPALVFVAVFMMPLYYGSGAPTLPGYLWLRFDKKTGLLNACTFALMTLASAGISLYLMARIFVALHIFDSLFYAYGWPHQAIFSFCVLLPAIVVLNYVLFAGLAGAIINQALQFVLIVAAFLPMVLKGLENAGGWGSLKASLPAAYPHQGSGFVLLLGLIFGAGYWMTDFRILQSAMAARNIESARRIPLFAAALRLLLPFLLILPGVIAIGLPTPHSTTVTRSEDGAIYHEITVVPREASEGVGLVPARIDPATGNPLLDSAGHTLLNYDRSTPAILMHFLPTGLLGLGLAALLAFLMSGLAAGITSFNAVFACDLYPTFFRKASVEPRSPAVGRWAALGAVLLSIGAAYAVAAFNGLAFNNIFDALLLVFSLVNAPQLATYLLGMFTRGTTGHGAFAGMVAGIATALLHLGLTLAVGANPGLQGGWITVVHRYPSFMAQCFWTAIVALTINLIVAILVSLTTQARPEAELKGLVHSLKSQPAIVVWWKRPEAMAAAILCAAAAIALLFA